MKRGLNEIVTSVIIILLVLVSIGIIWTVLKPTIESTVKEADVGSITTNLEIIPNSLSTNLTDCNISFQVSRSAGNSVIDSLRIVIQQKNLLEKMYSFPQQGSLDLKELESKEITITDCSINEEEILSITVYPVFANSKIGQPSKEKISQLESSIPPAEGNVTNPSDEGNETSVVQKGSRLLGIDITWGDTISYDPAFDSAQSFGMDFTTLTFLWNKTESSQGNYDFSDIDLANWYYPTYKNNSKLAIVLAPPIDTNAKTLPDYLVGRSINDTLVVQRYNNLADQVLSRLPDVDLVYLSIGNEIDVYLKDNLTEWDQFIDFYNKTSTHIRQNHTNVKIGSKATQDAYFYEPQKTKMQKITEMSDAVLVTYYLIYPDFFAKYPDIVFQDFDNLDNFSTKPVYITETGYSSSSVSNSSEEKQELFFENIINAWDSHASGIPIVNVLWLHDRTASDMQGFEIKYNNTNGVFTEHIRTLGIKNVTGSDKLSAQFLRTALSERGW